MKTTTPAKVKKATFKRQIDCRAKLVVGDDVWEIVNGGDGLAVVADDLSDISAGECNIIVVDPSSRRIITGDNYNDSELGEAIRLAIEASEVYAKQQAHNR